MKKLILLSSFFISTIYAHECKYTLNVDIDMNKGLLRGNAVITSDHPTMQLLDTKANISEIKGASLSVDKNIQKLLKQDKAKSVEISFTHNFTPIDGDAVLLDNWYPQVDMMCRYETVVKSSNIITTSISG